MRGRAFISAVCWSAAAGLAAAASPAQARPAFTATAIMAPSALYSAVSAACASEASSFTASASNQSKSGAILGSSMSKLERMRMQQSEAAAPLIATGKADGSSAFAQGQPLRPAIGMARQPLSFCATQQDASGLADARQSPAAAATRGIYSKDDFLASKRVTIGRTMFDNSWNRVRSNEISRGTVERYLGQSEASGIELLEQVNRWANQRIRYVEDRDLHGQADYWAGADTTLRLKSGDCEDIAIVKMQMLAAAGVPREDMFLTIARDLVRNADHAFLVVRTDQGYYLLDNAVDRLVDASTANDYRPVLSFNDRTSWLHGY